MVLHLDNGSISKIYTNRTNIHYTFHPRQSLCPFQIAEQEYSGNGWNC